MSRDRLIELHEEAGILWNEYIDECLFERIEPNLTYDEFHATHLLSNGVIVPPCKVGTTIYEAILLKKKKFSHFRECKVVGFHTGEFPDLRGHKRDNYLIVYYDCGHLGHIPYDKIGKTVFLDREDAERVLEEMQNNGGS